MAIEKTITIKVDVDGADANLKKLEGSLDNVTKAGKKTNLSGTFDSSSDAIQVLDSKTKGLASGFIEVGRAAKVGGKAMKSALISSGVGILLVIVSEIVANWDSIVDFISGANDELQDQINLGKEIVSDLEFQLDILKIQKKTLENQGKSTEEIKETIKRTLETQLLQEETLLNQEISQSQIELSKAAEFTWWQKIQFASGGVLGTVTLISEEEKKQQKEREEALEDRKKGIETLKLKLSELDKEEQNNRDKKNKDLEKADALKQKQLDKDIAAEKKRTDAIKALDEKLREEIKDQEAITRQEKLELEIQRKQEDLDNLVATAEEKEELQLSLDIIAHNEREALRLELKAEADAKKEEEDKEAADKKKQQDAKELAELKAVEDSKLAIKNAAADATGTAFNILSQFAGKNKKLQKASLIGENAVGIAKNIINTNAANARLTLEGGIAAPALVVANNIRMYTGIAASIAATAKGLSAIGASGGGGSAGSAGGAAPSAPSFNLVQGSGSNQIAESLANQDRPLKAFVVSGDVTSSQSLDRNIEQNSSL